MRDIGHHMLKKRTSAAQVIARAEPPEQFDGRAQRSHNSQQRIVAAMIELVAEGNMTPSAEKVAERAEVGLRSVFRHFKDMDNLYRAISDTVALSMERFVSEPFKSIEWHDRVLELVDRRAVAFEKMTPFLRAGLLHRHRSPVLKAGQERFAKTLRHIMIGLLPAHIARDGRTVETIDLLLSFEAWHRLRDDQRLDVAKAKRVLKGAIGALLEPHTKKTE